MGKAEFKVGDKVVKTKGYKFVGTIVSVFYNTKGERRVVAELQETDTSGAMLHIFNESQLGKLAEENLTDDEVVKSVIEDLNSRSKLGLKK